MTDDEKTLGDFAQLLMRRIAEHAGALRLEHNIPLDEVSPEKLHAGITAATAGFLSTLDGTLHRLAASILGLAVAPPAN